MKKKSKNKQSSLFKFVVIILGLAAITMVFLPAIKTDNKNVNGLNVVFGYKEKVLLTVLEVFKFSFINLLVYLVVIAGIALTIYRTMVKDCAIKKLLTVALFAIAGIGFFMTINFAVLGDGISWLGQLGANPKDSMDLGIGPIVAGVVSCLASVITLYTVITDKK